MAGYVYFTATGEEFDAKATNKRDWFIGESRLYAAFYKSRRTLVRLF